jgi:hypothetical protein
MTQTPKLVQPALEVAQDVHLLTVEVFKREELGEVKLFILKEGNDNVCLECRDGHAHYTTPNNPVTDDYGLAYGCRQVHPGAEVLSWSANRCGLQGSSDRRPIVRLDTL